MLGESLLSIRVGVGAWEVGRWLGGPGEDLEPRYRGVRRATIPLRIYTVQYI